MMMMIIIIIIIIMINITPKTLASSDLQRYLPGPRFPPPPPGHPAPPPGAKCLGRLLPLDGIPESQRPRGEIYL